jgi:arylsulfatase A-like enzyme
MTATLMELFGVPVPERVIGQSLLSLLDGKRVPWHRKAAVMGSASGNGGFVQVMDGAWSYTVWRGERKPALHHVVQDPNCRKNSVADKPRIASRLWKEAAAMMKGQGLGEDWLEGYRVR